MFVSGEEMFVSLRGVVDLQVLRLLSPSFQGNAGGMCRRRGSIQKASQITEHQGDRQSVCPPPSLLGSTNLGPDRPDRSNHS